MDINNLKQILSDLRNCDTFVKESFDFYSRSNGIKEHADKFESRLDDAKITKVDECKPKLKSIQNKCEKDNTFAKKSITISRIDLIKSLFKALEDCGDRVASYVRSDFSSGEKLFKGIEDTEKAIKKLDNLCDEVFSFKDTFDMYFVTNELLKFIGDFKVDIVFDVIDDCVDSIKDDEEDIEEFSNFRLDNKIGGNATLEAKRQKMILLHKKLDKVPGLIYSYEDVAFKIFNKTYQMINGFCDKYNK